MSPDKQLFINVPFQSTKHRKKELCVDHKVQVTIGDVYCPTCRIEKCVTFQPIKRLVSTTVKSATPERFEYFPFKDQKPTIMLFGGDGTHCIGRKTSRDYEKEKPFPFLTYSFFRIILFIFNLLSTNQIYSTYRKKS